MSNRLSDATSPYLLQHADNPVDWWEWGPEAFAEAERRGVPIFLSVGYAACHWCHVMAHESFENEATAGLINERFVAIKVDREERPDVDAVYMAATQALTGQGGWPMTVFLTPDRRPFYAGTYFPPRPAHGMPAFTQVLDAVSEAWVERRDEVLSGAEQIGTELAARQPKLDGHQVTDLDLDTAVETLRSEFDAVHAGFGRAPKFPPSMVLKALLRLGETDMADRTLDAMARGGIYDQLGGGFARYSVDAGWVVPHFEKMLYDNALLLGAYVHWWRLRPSDLAARVVAETIEWLLAEMLTPEGGFAASLDADSLDPDGQLVEGAFYVWTPEDLVEVLGPDAAWAAKLLRVTPCGTFEHGASTLQLPIDPDDPERWGAIRTRLHTVRSSRPRPGRDDKVVTAWNGWLVDALVQAGTVFDRSDWLQAAETAGGLLWRLHWRDGRLVRTSRGGVAGTAPGLLEDYAALALAATRLAAAIADPEWIERARTLVAAIEELFDDGAGGYFDTAVDAEQLYTRPRDVTDNATPSGLATTVQALNLLAELTGESGYAERAERAAATAGLLVAKAPRFAGWLLADAVTRLRRPPVQVAIAGDPADPAAADLSLIARRLVPAGSVVVVGEPDRPGVALLADRTMIGGRPTAYVCRGFVCRLPVTTQADLIAQLGSG